MKRFAVVFGIAVAVACASASKGRLAEAPPRAPHDTAMGAGGSQDQKSEILRLAAEIETKREQLQLLEPTQQQLDHAPTQEMANPVRVATCRPGQSDVCKTSCTLSDSICDNAGRICKLAKSLTADMEATQKCARANTVCAGASEKCCTCR